MICSEHLKSSNKIGSISFGHIYLAIGFIFQATYISVGCILANERHFFFLLRYHYLAHFHGIFAIWNQFSFPFESIQQPTFQLICTAIAYASRKFMVFDFICFEYYNEFHWNPLKLPESVGCMYVGERKKNRHWRKKWQSGWRKTLKKRPNRPTNQPNVDPNERSLM